MCSVYGSGATSVQTFRNWFNMFRTGNFHLEDEECSSRRTTTVTEIIKAMVDENPRYTVPKLADI